MLYRGAIWLSHPVRRTSSTIPRLLLSLKIIIIVRPQAVTSTVFGSQFCMSICAVCAGLRGTRPERPRSSRIEWIGDQRKPAARLRSEGIAPKCLFTPSRSASFDRDIHYSRLHDRHVHEYNESMLDIHNPQYVDLRDFSRWLFLDRTRKVRELPQPPSAVLPLQVSVALLPAAADAILQDFHVPLPVPHRALNFFSISPNCSVSNRISGQSATQLLRTIKARPLKQASDCQRGPPSSATIAAPWIVLDSIRMEGKYFLDHCIDSIPPASPGSRQLVALAQNAALRLDCDRVVISLLDGSTRYVVAEATRNSSLSSPVSNSNILLRSESDLNVASDLPGTSAFFSGQESLESSNKLASTSFVAIRNIKLDRAYRDLPFVASSPLLRSLLEVPVRNSEGLLTGVLTALDARVRDDFAFEDKVAILADLALCVADHLATQANLHRSMRDRQLVYGLSSLFTPSTFAEPPEVRRSRNGAHETRKPQGLKYLTSLSSSGSASSTMRSASSEADSSSNRTPSPATSTSEDADDRPSTGRSDLSALPEANHTQMAQDLLAPSDRTFSRAAQLMQQSVDLDGLMVFNAEASQTKNANDLTASDILAKSLRPNLQSHDFSPILEARLLNTLECDLPSGGVARLNADGHIVLGRSKSSKDGHTHPLSWARARNSKALSELLHILGDATSVILVPLAAAQGQDMSVSLLGWTTDSGRALNAFEITCLRTFGDIARTQLAQYEAHDIVRSKSNFLSSISHELRSPLHGILASIELLRASDVMDDHGDLIDMMQNCSSTLLDTLNHLLDYSKINDFTDAKGHARASGGLSRRSKYAHVFGKQSPEYLCKLVQDVVEGVHFGQKSQRLAAIRDQAVPIDPFKGREQPHVPSLLIDESPEIEAALNDSEVGLLIWMESRAEWYTMLSTGAWKRVIMNVVSNSMKYCRTGHIEVSLTMLSSEDGQDARQGRVARLTIQDTGIGMSKDFVQNKLFKPFAQENSLVDGSGLGLSIVRQIVHDLQGTITVDSTPGVGTCFDVRIPIGESPAPPPGEANVCAGGDVLDPEHLLRGRTLCLLTEGDEQVVDAGSATELDSFRRRTAALHRIVAKIASEWFGMQVVTTHDATRLSADIVVTESAVWQSQQARQGTCTAQADQKVVVVGQTQQGAAPKETSSHSITHLSYPVGPKSLSKALFAALKGPSSPPENTRDEMDIDPSPPTTTTKRPRLDPLRAMSTPNLSAITASSHHRLLLVDDNAINLRVLRAYATKLGLPAETARNGYEAVQRFKGADKPFTVVLMDISMPVMDGFEASRGIRRYEREVGGGRRACRIIALTGLGSEVDRAKAVECGIDDYRVKPVALVDLRELLGMTEQ